MLRQFLKIENRGKRWRSHIVAHYIAIFHLLSSKLRRKFSRLWGWAGWAAVGDGVLLALVDRQIARELSAGQPDHILEVGAPQPRGAIPTAGQDLLPVGRNGQSDYPIGVPNKLAQLLAGLRISQPRDLPAIGEYVAAIRREDAAIGVVELAQLPARCHLPDPYGSVEIGGDYISTVRRERHAKHPIGMTGEGAHVLARRCVPQPYGLIVAASKDILAVG